MNKEITQYFVFIITLCFSLLGVSAYSQMEEEYIDYNKADEPKIEGNLNILLDFKNINYSEFEIFLGSENVNFMNKNNASAIFEYGLSINDYYYGLNFGIYRSTSRENDSISIEFNTTSYGVVFGYNRINTGDVIIRPEVGITWYRSRLLNYEKDKKISLNSYLENRDLDIRFNNILGYMGLNFSYKLIDSSKIDFYTMMLGFYFGYNIALNKNTWVYSKRNRLITDKTINFDRYRIGFTICFLLD